MRARRTAALAALFLVLPSAVGGQQIAGPASVIDGDTIEIHETRIRLYGIDAPESGQRAEIALAAKIGRLPVACEPKERDQYDRVVAVCSAAGENLNAWLVARGWALAYRQYSADYVPQEKRASAAKLGIWRGEFVPPWDWRQGKWLAVTEAQQPAKCLIKGNIGRSGERIYHVPGGQYYDKTVINPVKGERWFCSEADARAAGWRKSKR